MTALRGTLRWALNRIPRWPTRWRPRGQNVVVLYHRLAALEEPDPLGMVVHPQRFRQHMEMLAAYFEIVPAHSIRTTGPRPRAAITFDDGYAENLSVAAPILTELALPATFFLTTDAFEHETEFWWDRLEHLVRGANSARAREVRVGRRKVRISLANDAARRQTLRQLANLLVAEHPSVVERTIADIAEVTGWSTAPCLKHRRLSTDEAQALAAEPLFDIGSHTCSHSTLRRLSRCDSAREITASRRMLGDLLGEPPSLLAYPYGAPGTIVRRNAAEARRAGYSGAFVNTPAPADGAHRFAVPRIAVGDWEWPKLLALLRQWSP